MKTVVWTSLVFAAHSWAGEPADRIAIERVIAALNADQASAGQKPIADLFTADADNELNRLASLDRRLVPSSDRPWSEVTTPRIVVQHIRWITPDVALVDAANTQYGSTILVRRVPMLLVVKKEGKDWRIASLRVLVDLMGLP